MDNPILNLDFPDPDVIRVDDVYYMASTTMHFMPGCAILKSYDLLNWEFCGHVFDELEDLASHHLEDHQNIYGQGMWAPCLRYHRGKFYVCFSANDTKTTYLFEAERIEGPWKKRIIEGFYYDSSLLFDEDRVFIYHGQTSIRITELNSDLSGPKEGGLDQVIIKDEGNISLGYEGSHAYKIQDKYVLFLIHWPADGNKRRCEACYVSDSPEGKYSGRDVLDDDMDFMNQGVAQGGIVDTPTGEWYGILFQDRGAVGRIPVLVPVCWENGFPVFGIGGSVPKHIEVKSTRPDYHCQPLCSSGDHAFELPLNPAWEWNHLPDKKLISFTNNTYTIKTKSLCFDVCEAVNTLTQRMYSPRTCVEVCIDGGMQNDGDVAGLCAFQSAYGLIGLTKDKGNYYVVLIEEGKETKRVQVERHKIRVRMYADFERMKDQVMFFYLHDNQWIQMGEPHRVYFRLDHFVGCRAGLCSYSTKKAGGSAVFSSFKLL